MLTKNEIVEMNWWIVRQVRIVQATRRMVKEAGLDLPVLTELSIRGRKLAARLQEVIKEEELDKARPLLDREPGSDDVPKAGGKKPGPAKG